MTLLSISYLTLGKSKYLESVFSSVKCTIKILRDMFIVDKCFLFICGYFMIMQELDVKEIR